MSPFLRSLRLLGFVPLLALAACNKSPSAAPAAATGPSAPADAASAPAKPAALAAPATASPLPVIGAAPAWSVTTLDGQALSGESLKGKVVVIDFWATWCGPCVHEIPGYIALQKKYADRGLVFVGLSVDQKGEAVVAPFAKKMGVTYPLAMSTTEIVEAFGGLEAIPTTLLIDREGKIRHRKVGAMETDDYEKLILSVL